MNYNWEKLFMRIFEFHKGHGLRTVIKELLHEGQSLLEEMDIVHNMSNFFAKPLHKG